MTFEELLREKIKATQPSSQERTVLKVVLGEYQQKASAGKVTDEVCHTIVKKMIQSNKENLGYLPAGDVRRDQYVLENEVLAELLPSYLTAAQIRESLEAAGIDVKSVGEGQATGKAMQHFKSLNAAVEGQTVKEVVQELRKS